MKILFWGYFTVVFIVIINGDSENKKIDPKLDFNESKEDTTDKTLHRNNTDVNKKFSSPKIHGVRVTVDTGNVKQSKEVDSNEGVEIIDTKKSRKIGIHTDITFEIIGDKDNSNATSSGTDDDNDASVPVFKGYGSHGHRNRDDIDPKKPKKPYDPRYHQPHNNFGGDGGQYYPTSRDSSPEIYVRPRPRNDYDIYRTIDSWKNYVPITRLWTTERSYYPSYQSHQATHGTEWKPCYCLTDITDSRVYKRNSINKIKSPPLIKVNNKLDKPFFNSEKKRK